MAVETIALEEFHARLKAQGVARADIAFQCPMCRTVQSMRKVVRLRKMDLGKRQEEEALLDLYLSALDGTGISMETAIQVVQSIGGAVDEDALYSQAVELVVKDRKASTSYVQRTQQLGYNRAAALIERMEREGVVGAANHAGKREVLSPPPGGFKPATDSVAVASIHGRNAVKDAAAEHRPVAPNPYDRGTPQHRVWAEAARDEALKLGVEL